MTAYRTLNIGDINILQIHPTRFCNLTCQHCYSSSSPHSKEMLSWEMTSRAISDAASLGYNTVSFSGGEPFLYPDFEKALQLSKKLALKTLVVTNGFFINKQNIDFVLKYLDVVAISIDGPEHIHNEMRNSKTAFKRAGEAIALLKKNKLKFGIIHTLTKRTYEHIYWLLTFAKTNGASLLQIHPLEKTGRATGVAMDLGLDQDSLQRVYASVFVAAQHCDNGFDIQLDLVHKDIFENAPDFIFRNEKTIDRIPASSQKIIVLQQDGIVVPATYGFSNKYMIADLNRESLVEGWAKYMNGPYDTFLKLNRELIRKVNSTKNIDIFNWTEMMLEHSFGHN